MTIKFKEDTIQRSFPDYKILRYLKTGGFKSVYLAKKNGNKYVIKILDPKDLARIKREIRAFMLVKSPYVARLLRYGEKIINRKNIIFFIEEYIEGKELSLLINEGKAFENLKIIDFLKYAILGIESIWNPHKIVHRDIKPSNIIIKTNGKPVLLDLGIARHQTLPSLTPSAIIGPGTPGYRSPEQLKCVKRRLNLRSDFFCLGICAFLIATLKHPFYEDDRYIADDSSIARFPTELNRNIHPAVSNLITKFIAKKVYKRPRNCQIALALISKTKEMVLKNEKKTK